MNSTDQKNCPVCTGSDVQIFIELSGIPVQCNWLLKTRQEALDAKKGNIRLAFCRTCSHVYNIDFNSEWMEYTQDYENSLHFSPRFRQYARDLADRLVRQYNVRNKCVIEIGCGKGDFLFLLCELGNNRGIGFDPSFDPQRMDEGSKKELTIIRDYYSEHYADYVADLMCCRHVLEHIHFPRKFLNTIRQSLKGRKDTILFFEVPNVVFTLKDGGIWDLIYEHCGYFSPESLRYLFHECGFRALETGDTFNGQFLYIDAKIDDPSGTISPGVLEIAGYAASFSERYQTILNEWRLMIDQIERTGKKVVVWGAGSKGIMFLNMLAIKNQIDYIVDINPHKQGRYVPGTGQKIVSPEFLKEYRPDTVIVMNPIYLDEIKQILKEIDPRAECIGMPSS